MLPSKGAAVFYHFAHRDAQGEIVMQSRPAIVIDVHATEPGVVLLAVFYSPHDDDQEPSDFEYWTGTRRDVPAHREGSHGEFGVIQRENPKPRSWTWRP